MHENTDASIKNAHLNHEHGTVSEFEQYIQHMSPDQRSKNYNINLPVVDSPQVKLKQ